MSRTPCGPQLGPRVTVISRNPSGTQSNQQKLLLYKIKCGIEQKSDLAFAS